MSKPCAKLAAIAIGNNIMLPNFIYSFFGSGTTVAIVNEQSWHHACPQRPIQYSH